MASFSSGLGAGLQVGSIIQQKRQNKIRQEELAAQQAKDMAAQVQDRIQKNMEVIAETVTTLDQQGIPRSDPRYQAAIKPLADQTLSLAQRAQMSNMPVDPRIIQQRIENTLKSPTPEQELKQKAKEKATLTEAETRAEQSVKSEYETPDTKKVWDREAGQLVFATDKQITENPNRFVPFQKPDKPSGAQLKTAIHPQTGETMNAVFRPDDPTNVTTIDGQPLPEGFVVGDITGTPGEFTTKTQGALEEDVVTAKDTLVGLEKTMESFDPEFLTYFGKFKAGTLNILDKFGAELSDDQKEFIKNYSEFAQNSIKTVNETIKQITGAQMSEKEAGRIRKQVPDPENNAPTEFKTKLENSIAQMKLAIARKQYMLKNGIEHDFSSDEEPPVSLEGMKQIINARGKELMDSGVPREQAIQQVRQEFGL